MTAVGQIRRMTGSDAGAECTSAVDDTSETLTDMAGDLMVIPPLLVRHEKRLADKERTFVTHVTKSAIPDRVPLTPTPPLQCQGIHFGCFREL